MPPATSSVVPGFTGTFLIEETSGVEYTFKSRYLTSVELRGSKDTDLLANDQDGSLTGSTGDNRIEGGGVRVNGQPCRKPGRAIRPGDRLTISAHGRVRVLTVAGLAERRGPAVEAQQLYTEDRDGLIDPAEATR